MINLTHVINIVAKELIGTINAVSRIREALGDSSADPAGVSTTFAKTTLTPGAAAATVTTTTTDTTTGGVGGEGNGAGGESGVVTASGQVTGEAVGAGEGKGATADAVEALPVSQVGVQVAAGRDERENTSENELMVHNG